MIKPVLLGKQITNIKRELYALQKKEAEHVGKRFAAMLESHLMLTTRYWNQSGENSFDYPKMKAFIKIVGNPNQGVTQLTVRVLMTDNGGNPHFLWHILDQGRRTYTFPVGKRTPPLRRRKSRRTRANVLKADPFPGFTGDIFVIHGGEKVKGVPGNHWYKAAADAVIKEAKRDKTLKLWIPKIHIEPMTKGA